MGLALTAGAGRAADPAPPQAAPDPAAACAYIPPWLEPNVLYYNPFEGDPKAPRVNRLGAETLVSRGTAAPGLAGHGLQVAARQDAAGPVQLRSPALSPDRPLTLSLWWRLDAPLAAESVFHLVTLRGGRGMVANFVRGKGEWCALTEPRFVFQVVYFEGIPDINGIWHGDAWVEPTVWHHTAMVFRNASEVDVYWDGLPRSHYVVKGRPFRPGDGGALEIGPNWLFHPMTVDDLLVLDRALAADEVAAYVLAARRLAELAFPVLARE